MSIESFFLRIRRSFVFPLLVSVFVLCLIPVKGYGWFHHPKALGLKQNSNGLPVFKDNRNTPNITTTYSILHNRGEKEKTPTLYPGSTGIGVTAGTVNIDIPFDILSKTAISPETSLDRQIAADLRLKNIIDEYLSLKKRNTEVLKGLSIPYLEKNEALPKKGLNPVPEKIKAEKEAKKNMEDIIVFLGGRRAVPVTRPEVVSQVAGAHKRNRQETISVREISKSRPSPEYLEKKAEAVGRSSYQTAYGHNTDLPWFFSFALKLIRYTVHHKLEILSWAAVLIMSGLIGTIVVKK